MAITWITPKEFTLSGTGSFVDVDVSADVSASATGVILHFHCPSTAVTFGWRKNGSTDNRQAVFTGDTHLWAAIGVDASGIFEAITTNTANIDVFLVGYFEDDAHFFDNGVDHSLTTLNAFTDIDITADTVDSDVAIAAILEITQTGTGNKYGLRKNGSTDDRVQFFGNHIGAIIGCDGDEIFEGEIAKTTTDWFLNGYLTKESTFNTNATDVSLGSTGSFINLTALPSGATGGYIEVHSSVSNDYGLRVDGSSENIVARVIRHEFGMVEAASLIVEGQIANTGTDFFVVGYSEAAAAAGGQPTMRRWGGIPGMNLYGNSWGG